MKNVTLVTGLWDIKRSDLTGGWSRSFEDHYITKFKELLQVPYNLIVFGEEELQDIVFEIRDTDNTQFIERSQDWFKNEFYNKIQEIRKDPKWYNQVGWLKDSTQGSLEMYNPLVMSKMFMLNDANIMSRFNTEFIYWIDAGLTTTVHPGYFTHDRVLDKVEALGDKFHFICFPYETTTEIHGFKYPEINSYAGGEVKKVARGGFFGGPKTSISKINGFYYQLLSSTLYDGLMGTEESIFSIMVYKYPDFISYSMIEGNGLVSKFFEDLKNDPFTPKPKPTKPVIKKSTVKAKPKVGLYVITFNSPKQFETLCKSFELYDNSYLKQPEKFLLNNSTDKSTDKQYTELCKKYNFKQIKKGNLGICGGRQFIAEHFDENKHLDFYLFFEDDMFFYNGKDIVCRNGFIRKVENIYTKTLEIIKKESYDFLKFNFTEFFGDNHKQWSWHNVPADVRKKLFPNNPVKKDNDISKAPNQVFTNILSYQGLPYASGEVYYCNWPQLVSRQGNKKMFLDTKWAHPYEQTWMSHIYQETVKGKIKPGILLATPTEHDRFDHYPKEERREN